jgi:hypothetical protein
MEHYVTLFDSVFLPQGLALHQSMERHAGAYTLWVLCMDLEAYNALKTLELPNVRPLLAERLETPELKAVKPTRTRAEYCWTMTPFTPRFVFEADSTVERVTYIDADMWFLKNPRPIFQEFEESGKQVLITEHAYAPQYDKTELSGRFCVQFMTFTRLGGEVVRKWWEERCIEWCFNRTENGKFGDQKYLDDWPERFSNRVHVLVKQELLLAPWNATRFPYSSGILFHFHELRILNERSIKPGNYCLPDPLFKYVYKNYFMDIKKAISLLQSVGFRLKPQIKSGKIDFIRHIYYRYFRDFVFAFQNFIHVYTVVKF